MQQTPPTRLAQRRLYLRITFVACILALVVLGLFQSIWVYGGSSSGIMLQVGLQRTRTQAIGKNVLILSYRTDTRERAQATSDLQNILPAFERAQAGLQSGDKSLQLPRAPSEIQQLLFAGQAHYVAIDGALKQIVAHLDEPIDDVQRDIILLHTADYATALNQIHLAYQSRIDSAFLSLYWIETGITGAVILVLVATYVFPLRRLLVAKDEKAAAPVAQTTTSETEGDSH